MNKYLEYKKCGDVLVPASLNDKEQFILKCCECNEYFFILDALLDHYLVHDDEKNNSIEIKRKTSEDTTVPDDPLTTNQDFNDISDVFKLELDETAIIEVSTRSPPNFLKDNNYGDNKWEEYSNDNFDKSEHKYTQDYLQDNKDIIEGPQNYPQRKSLEEEKPFVCDECGSRLKTRKSLKRHKCVHLRVENKEHQCEQCKRIFEKSSSLKSHLRSHKDCYKAAESSNKEDSTEDEDWKPPISETTNEHKYKQDYLQDNKGIIERPRNYPPQRKCLEEEKPFACDECDSRLKTRKSLKRHKRIHLRVENKEHQCEHCKRIFEKSSSLKSHLRSHKDCYETAESSNKEDNTEDEDWKPATSETTKIIKNESTDHLSAEMKLENNDNSISPETDNQNEKLFACSECGNRLKTKKSLKRHLLIHLRQPGERVISSTQYECELCKKVFQKSSSLKEHLRTHTGEQPFLCSECGKSFKTISNLKQHFLRHGTDRPYECPDCPKTFPCHSDLASHKAVHTKAKSHVCDICGHGFVKPYLLKVHRMYHTGERNHKCDYCDMRFVQAEKCRRHMRTHTGEKPYKCKYCIKAFAQSNDLNKHLRQHLGENVYKCSMCPKGFRLQGELRTHFNAHKNDDEETRAKNLQDLKNEELRIQMKFGLLHAVDDIN